jgi:hypothetical protein
MATVGISIVWQDVEGLRFADRLDFDAGDIPTLIVAQAQLVLYEGLLENVSGGAIVEASVTFPLTVSASESPDAGYSVRSGAYLSFKDSDSVGQGLYIPCILGDKIIDDVVDADDTEMAALIDGILGNTSGTKPLSSRGSGSLYASYRGGKGASRKVKK